MKVGDQKMGQRAYPEAGDEAVFQLEREAMVREQLEGRGIRDRRVLEAMRRVPRHLFVPVSHRRRAYGDWPLPIGGGQTISQPQMVALMLEALDLEGTERVLEVGAGGGYQAALLGELAREVYAVEIVDELARRARAEVSRLGYGNVHVVLGDGRMGLAEEAPFDAIVVAAATRSVPEALVEQLADGGRLLIPVGTESGQTLMRIRRHGAELSREPLTLCAFVPLVGPADADHGG